MLLTKDVERALRQPLPAFIDLRALADELVGQEKYRRVRSELDRAAKAQSCAADLALGLTLCQTLSDLLPSPRKRNTILRQATEGALLQMAVILYERATSAAVKRGERGSVSVVRHLTPEQTLDHETIVRVRHRALAHVYPNEPVNGEIWQQDILLATAKDEAWQPLAAAKRIQFNLETYECLKRQLPVMHALMTHRFQENLTKAMSYLRQNPLPQATFDRHRVDPVLVFGGHDNVTAALEGRTTGSASFLGR